MYTHIKFIIFKISTLLRTIDAIVVPSCFYLHSAQKVQKKQKNNSEKSPKKKLNNALSIHQKRNYFL
ncbi:hypothetical protein, partial [Flavobacterium psychrophilum]|uniref:hypothetical protein n=1 Tax=Flavobacterium psychrophilum TaxID=96345 RepID=UPI001D098209